MRLSSGVQIAGKRHGDCLMMVHESGLSRTGAVQGFMTTAGRFVDRAEARRLQQAAGRESADAGGYRGDVLYSEDLY